MKNRKFQKMLSYVLVGACAIGLLAGCGNTASKESSESKESSIEKTVEQSSATASTTVEETGITYPLSEKVTLRVAVLENANVTAKYKDVGETPFGQAWQEATGVNVEFEQYASGQAMNLMFASGDLPDIVIFPWSAYSGGAVKAIEDKIIMPINDYVEYAPDLMAVLESNEIFRKSCMTPNGDMIGFPFARGDEFLQTSFGLIIRTDFLEQVDMEIPNTPDDLYNVLKAFKEELNIEAPFSTTVSNLIGYGGGHGLMTTPFGLPSISFYQENGKVQLGYYKKEYKDVLAFWKKLKDEDLLDKNYTVGVDARANLMNGIAGVIMDTPGGGIGTMVSTMKDDPTFDIAGFGPLVAKAGDTPMMTHYDNPITHSFSVITPACKNVEAAMKFLNYGYTEEGHMLFNFGIEGVSYEMKDGYPAYTDLILNNPDGLAPAQIMPHYLEASIGVCGYVQDKAYMEQYAGAPQQQQALAQWTKSDSAKYKIPQITIPAEDNAEYLKLMGDIETYMKTMTIDYINGDKDLAGFETEYLKTMKELGADRAIEIYQKALDEFNAR